MKHFFASAAMAALMVSTPALADTPDDQLVAAFTMNNILTMDPAAITGGEAVQVLNNVYDALVQFDPETYELQPRIAESWEYSDDNRSVTLTLRPYVTFASGNPLTAEDVKFSLDRVMKLGLAQSSGLSSRGFTAENVDEHFVVEDDHTFTINLPQADDPQLILMYLTQAGIGSILDRDLVMEHEENGDMGQAWLTNNSAGSGAFVLDRWQSNEYVILTRNDEFWDGVPEMQRVLMRHLPESQSQRLGLEQGDIDVGFTLAAPDLRALEDAEGIEVETVPSAGFYYLAASMEDERFANPKVREALRYLIDYDGINSAIMPYFGVERQRPVNTNAFGALDDPGYELDVERARELLAEAGYEDGFDTTIRVISEQQFLDSATAIQNTLGQAGINAEIITGDGGQIYGAMRDRDFELLVGRGGGGQEPHPDSNLRATVYNPDNSQEAGLTNYQGWRTSYQDEELNEMIETALTEGDRDRQIELYGEIQEAIDEKVTTIQPFSERVVTAAYQDEVDGLIINPWITRFEDVTKDR
ncbi:peptide/nickel transport system substrate-binding protein [Palleronia marisminoris]|uniref:Putative D,D-dipeptide-binding periplasmic protein DdpA n=1 Tax=Palleronia marisminoris TaxID=315423 RepID=A0A1Y5S4N5_9RHOB|nr:ABC transporter substrate-binding protein [Palleronia marisminoris]SFG38516.1 peptide/nickel transport system substrate-binding protein [Palleronia marisminoris]SLN29687.1 putative D,D-dipeptide-binding periplasmic protein DdpA precursor [Palleronia marisminoris]